MCVKRGLAFGVGGRPKCAKQLLDRPMAGLGIGVFMERDQVPVWVEDGELHGSPGLRGERRIRVNDGVACALPVQPLNALNAHSATRGFGDATIRARPEMDLHRPIGDDAVFALRHMHLFEAQLGHEELDASLDIK